MNKATVSRALVTLAVAAACACTLAFAGGPLQIYDPATRTPYAWPAGNTPVYLDLGTLGPLTNEQADALMTAAIAEWNAVPSSSFHAVIAGDFGSIGLPDIKLSNVDQVIDQWNGGGIHVIYDSDGSIHKALFGSATSVLGFTVLEYVSDSSPAILEAYMVMNGAVVSASAPQRYAGVMTHEFGHALGLAHSQTNGQMYFGYDPYIGPEFCDTAFPGFPDPSQIETMYPFINLRNTGPEVRTVDRLDDIAAISDLYPQSGWPASAGTIRGTIRKMLNIRGNGSGDTEEVTAINVIARNVADPLGDTISAVSGNFSQGGAGPDGAFTFNGLTPGASYAVYVDGLWNGDFSVRVATLMPGPEEWWNTAESGDGVTDDRCAYSPIPVAAGAPVTADVTFNRVKGAPIVQAIELPSSSPTDLSYDGGVVVGQWGGGSFRWTPEGGPVPLGGYYYQAHPGVSPDGTWISGQANDTTSFPQEMSVPAFWQDAENWTPIAMLPGHVGCGEEIGGSFDVSNTGKIVGYSFENCTNYWAFEWTPEAGIRTLGSLGPVTTRYSSRAGGVSADGATIVGFDTTGVTSFWRGARWDNGVESFILLDSPRRCATSTTSPFYQWWNVGVAYNVSASGQAIVGEGFPFENSYQSGPNTVYYCDLGGWLWTPTRGVEPLGPFEYPYWSNTTAIDSSDYGDVVVGSAFGPSSWDPPLTMLWTRATGALEFQGFLEAQGTFVPGWQMNGMGGISDDGHTIAGAATTQFGTLGWVVQIPKVVICHNTPATPHRAGRKDTMDVTFPDALADHLGHGDTIGLCGNGM